VITIEQRTTGEGKLSQSVSTAVSLLWRSRQFSTADIAELLTIPEHIVARSVSVGSNVIGAWDSRGDANG
jgi:hypothetical protein